VSAYVEPAGSGVRVDGSVFTGYEPSPFYDPLLLKLICSVRGEQRGGTSDHTFAR
jgi:acetyl/propionyl-CoA carboxylase alpha subunit